MATTTTTVRTHWVNEQTGQLICSDHAGYELKAGIGAKPTEVEHDTAFGVYLRLRTDDLRYFAENVGYICEKCHEIAHRGA